MKLVIDRTKWLRGDSDESFLLRARDGKMCCLGFYSLACGLTKEQIKSVTCPYSLSVFKQVPLPESMEWAGISGDPTCPADQLMMINDANVGDTFVKSEEHREQQITKIFAQQGVEVEFIN